MLKNNKKAGDALIMLCYTCAFGAFGAFFRWLQMQVARDTETGLINPSILNILLPLLIVAAAVVLWLRSKKLTDDETVFPTGMSEALRGLSLLYIIFAWIIAALAVLGGILTIAETSLDNLRSMYVIIAALAMLSGLSFPLICSASRSHYSPSLVSVFMTIPILIQYFRGSFGKVEMGPMMASIMMNIIPIIIVYLLCQKHIIKGVVAGAVKG